MRSTQLLQAAAVSVGAAVAVDWNTPPAVVQNNTFNATHGRYGPAEAEARIAKANLPDHVDDTVLTALNFERSNWAGTSVRLDPFYTDIPSNWTDLPAGSIIKVEEVTDTNLYTLPATVALSRFLFTTKTVNGTVIPASAYLLWPWLPRKFSSSSSPDNATDDGIPVIAWGHGTSGWSGECGPSHIRTLWYQFMITTAATQGYAVVAPDYAGLGLDHDGRGNFIAQQYLVNQAHGNDLLYSVKAANQAWDILSERYVVMGHSQGGGAAWGAARVLASPESSNPDIPHLRSGYLGTVAGSPWTALSTSLAHQPTAESAASLVARIATGIKSVYPSFSYSDWLTPLGIRVVELMQDLQGCQSVVGQLLTRADMVRSDWKDGSWYYDAWDKLTSLKGKEILGPLLVIQGDDDAAVNVEGIREAVDAACEANPGETIEYVEHAGVSHTPIMFSAQQTWLKWIEQRFEGKGSVKGGECKKERHEPAVAIERYQFERNWFLEWTDFNYGVA